jgi:mono/diheme cytochrome c family protein
MTPAGYQRRRRLAIASAAAAAAVLAAAAWTLREDASVPPGPPEVAGRILFEKKRCVRCHRVAGAGGLVGPDLTGVARRKDAAWLDVYLEDPKAVRPDGKMPKPRLTPEQRAAVVAYLRTLDGEEGPSRPGARDGAQAAR